MTVPLVVLAGLSVVGGLVNTPLRTTLEHFLDPVFDGLSLQHPPEGWLMFLVLAGVSVLAGVAGIAAAYLAYRQPEEQWTDFEAGFEPLWGLWEDAYRVDDLYRAAIVSPGLKVAETTAFAIDAGFIDGAITGVGRVITELGARARVLQTGQVRNYAAFLLAGTIIAIVWLVAGGL
jgi:NADH-quinone oxidoreductase subunit L